MLKKEKPMMTVAAIIEQAQNRWMDQHPLQVFNRAYNQGSYCKYYCIALFVYFSRALSIFTSLSIHPVHDALGVCAHIISVLRAAVGVKELFGLCKSDEREECV